MRSVPVLFPQYKLHTGLVQALVAHPVCQHCYFCKVVQSQAADQLSDTALHQLSYLRTHRRSSQHPCPTMLCAYSWICTRKQKISVNLAC